MELRKKMKRNIVLIAIILILMAVLSLLMFTTKENNEISKKPAYLLEIPIYALDSSGVTVQQGNLVAYVESVITSTPENGYTKRTTYGVGDVVVFKIQFNKVLSSQSDAKLLFQFGSGATHTVTPTVSGSELIFRYSITSPDTGTLKVTGITGAVTDADGKTTQIGLPQNGGNSYIQASDINADTSAAYLIAEESYLRWKDESQTVLTAHYVFNEEIYKKENNRLRNFLSSDCYLIFLYNSNRYQGKGSYDIRKVSSNQAGQMILDIEYRPALGDYGNPGLYYGEIADIAGNISGNTGNNYTSLSLAISPWTPFVTNTPSVDYKGSVSYDGKKYLNAGDTISISVPYNEKLYKSVSYSDYWKNITATELNSSNITTISNISILIGSSWKTAKPTSISGNTITWTYTITNGDNGSYGGCSIPGSIVYDRVGHASTSSIGTGNAGIIVDTTAPTVSSITVNNRGIYKAGNTISYTINFSETVGNGTISTTFNNSQSQVTGFATTQGYTTTKTVSYTIKAGDNGYIIGKVAGSAFYDIAGNPVVARDLANTNLYADTTVPTIAISSNVTQTSGNMATYSITLSDNSTGWTGTNADGSTFYGGIAPYSLTLDEINVTNGTIIEHTTSNGNITGITVLANNDGKQRVYVGANTFTDTAKTGGNANNASAICDSVIIDTTKPKITNIDITPSGWTNQNVTITVQATDDTTGVAGYSFNGGAYSTSNTATVTANVNSYVIKVKDGVNNEISQTINITNIDKTLPSLAASITSTTASNATISISASDANSGLASVKVNGAEINLTNGSYTYNATSNGQYIITAVDNAGNIVSKEINVTTIDNVPPQITNVEKEISIWTNKNVKLTVYATDNYSGIAAQGYSFDGGATWQASNQKSFESNQTVHIKVKDNNGNIISKDVEIINIDKTVPTLTVSVEQSTINITAVDNESGIEKCEINGTDIALTNGRYTYTAQANGKYIITVTDVAKNTISKEIEVTAIDDKAPNITGIIKESETWTNKDVKITINATDSESGIAAQGYSFDGGTTWQASNQKSFAQNQTVHIKVKDNKGNIASRDIEITNIDKIAPTLTATVEENEIKIATTDNESGIAKCKINGAEIRLTNGSYVYTANQNGTYTIVAEDNAGNTVTKEISVKTIDVTAPEIVNIAKEASEWTNKDVKLTINAKDTESGIAEQGYSFDGGTTWQESNEKSFAENQTVHIKVKDNKGNTASQDIEINNIDRDAPKVELYIDKEIINIQAEDTLSGIGKCEVNGIEIKFENNAYEFIAEQSGKYIIKVTDKAGNTTTKEENILLNVLTKIFDNDEDIKVIKKENINYVILSKPMKAADLKAKSEKIEINIQEDLATGNEVTIERDKYIVVLKGDINGDGKIDINDMFKINKYRLGKEELTDAEWLASDINEDKTINVTDMFEINKFRLGKVSKL